MSVNKTENDNNMFISKEHVDIPPLFLYLYQKRDMNSAILSRFCLPFRLRFQLRPNKPGKPMTPHLPRCQGFAVAYYGFTLGRLDVVNRRSREREIWGILDFHAIRVIVCEILNTKHQTPNTKHQYKCIKITHLFLGG